MLPASASTACIVTGCQAQLPQTTVEVGSSHDGVTTLVRTVDLVALGEHLVADHGVRRSVLRLTS